MNNEPVKHPGPIPTLAAMAGKSDKKIISTLYRQLKQYAAWSEQRERYILDQILEMESKQ